MNRMKRLNKAMKMELREHRSSFLVYMILRILVVVVLCVQIYERNFESVFLSALTLLLLLIPNKKFSQSLCQRKFLCLP